MLMNLLVNIAGGGRDCSECLLKCRNYTLGQNTCVSLHGKHPQVRRAACSGEGREKDLSSIICGIEQVGA